MSQVNAKYLKDENGNVFSPITKDNSVIVGGGSISLYDYINTVSNIPIFRKVLYSSNSGFTVDKNNWNSLSNFTYTGFELDTKQYPAVLPGFKRVVRMFATYSDNVNGSVTPGRGIVIGGQTNSGSWIPEFNLSPIWGSLLDRANRCSVNQYDYDSLPKEHINFKAIIAGEVPEQASQGKIYYLEIQYLDKLIE